MQLPIETVHRAALKSRDLPVALRYAISTSFVVLIVLATSQRGGASDRSTFMLLIMVVLASATFLDRGNGFWATLLSSALCAYFLLPPVYSISVAAQDDQIALGLFLLTGLFVSVVVETLHSGLVALAEEHARATSFVNDRDLLLEELTHRTRNDFANVVTLLSLQARNAAPAVRSALEAAVERVQAVARVHRRLEIRGHRVVVDTRSYIGELCNDMRLTRGGTSAVAIECHSESHHLGIEKVIPLGLIINESVTNAIKHAFPDHRTGKIKVIFDRRGDNYHLAIEDDGVGKSGSEREGALGLRLMRMLAEQLGSTVHVEPRSPGTAIVVTIAVRSSNTNGAVASQR